jgi:hypothetical protein
MQSSTQMFAALALSKRCGLMKHPTLLAAALFLIGAGQTWASPLVGVTFNSSGGAPQWTNETGVGTTNNLKDETGANSGISLTTSATGSFSTFSVAVDSSTIPTGDSNLSGINGNIFGETSFTEALSGLAANSTYDVWLFVTRGGDPINQLVTITGAGTNSFSQTDGTNQQLVLNSMVGSSSEALGYYAVPIVSDSSGDINITITDEEGDAGAAVSGIAIQAAPTPTPEPCSLALMGLGGIGLAIGAKRRRKLAV